MTQRGTNLWMWGAWLGGIIGSGLLLLILALAGCEGPPRDDSPAGAAGSAPKTDAVATANRAKPFASRVTKTARTEQLYVEICAYNSADYWYDHKIGLAQAGRDLGVKTEYVGPAEYDMAAMVNTFEQVIAKRPQGILVVGFESVLIPLIDKAMDAGIPVVTLDADLPDSRRLCFIGTGNYQAGRQVGELLARSVGGKGKVAVTCMPSAFNLMERVRGFRDAIAKYPAIELVQQVDTQGDANLCAQSLAMLLQRYPDLAGLATPEGVGGAAASTAVREAGKIGRIKIVSMDRDNVLLQNIKDGVVTASVVQQTALMPYYALQLLVNLNNTALPISKDNPRAGVAGVPGNIDTGTLVVDRDNCELFMR